jgi:hypothetical protein
VGHQVGGAAQDAAVTFDDEAERLLVTVLAAQDNLGFIRSKAPILGHGPFHLIERKNWANRSMAAAQSQQLVSGDVYFKGGKREGNMKQDEDLRMVRFPKGT